jgi:hypothetical protein
MLLNLWGRDMAENDCYFSQVRKERQEVASSPLKQLNKPMKGPPGRDSQLSYAGSSLFLANTEGPWLL